MYYRGCGCATPLYSTSCLSLNTGWLPRGRRGRRVAPRRSPDRDPRDAEDGRGNRVTSDTRLIAKSAVLFQHAKRLSAKACYRLRAAERRASFNSVSQRGAGLFTLCRRGAGSLNSVSKDEVDIHGIPNGHPGWSYSGPEFKRKQYLTKPSIISAIRRWIEAQ
jgi:hypothetical protein